MSGDEIADAKKRCVLKWSSFDQIFFYFESIFFKVLNLALECVSAGP